MAEVSKLSYVEQWVIDHKQNKPQEEKGVDPVADEGIPVDQEEGERHANKRRKR